MPTATKKRVRANAFSADLCRELSNKCKLTWKVGTAEKGIRECVDVVGSRSGKQRVLIEVELRRTTPLANVVKVWKRFTKEKPGEKIVFFQAFSDFYPEKGTKRQNAEFVGKGMSDAFANVHYVPLTLHYSPKKRRLGQSATYGGGRRRTHARKLARRIVAKLRRIKL